MSQKKPRDRMVHRGRRSLMYDNRSALHNNFLPEKTYRNPFRISDERLVIGRYKGYKLDQVETQYLQWLYNNVEMSSTHKSILKNKIENGKAI